MVDVDFSPRTPVDPGRPRTPVDPGRPRTPVAPGRPRTPGDAVSATNEPRPNRPTMDFAHRVTHLTDTGARRPSPADCAQLPGRIRSARMPAQHHRRADDQVVVGPDFEVVAAFGYRPETEAALVVRLGLGRSAGAGQHDRR